MLEDASAVIWQRHCYLEVNEPHPCPCHSPCVGQAAGGVRAGGVRAGGVGAGGVRAGGVRAGGVVGALMVLWSECVPADVDYLATFN